MIGQLESLGLNFVSADDVQFVFTWLHGVEVQGTAEFLVFSRNGFTVYYGSIGVSQQECRFGIAAVFLDYDVYFNGFGCVNSGYE